MYFRSSVVRAARNHSRCWLTYNARIDPSKTVVLDAEIRKNKQAPEKLLFGKTFTDHMLSIDWDSETGWSNPVISAYKDLAISPAATSLHYGVQCFEGMKAYKDSDGRIRMFRPDMNMKRLNFSMSRLAMPELDCDGLIECIKQLLRVDESWMPDGEGYSMYIRPVAIGTSPYLGVEASNHVKVYAILSPVGPYFKNGFAPVKLYADTVNTRAWPGGIGNAKVGGNYGPTIGPARQAALDHGCQQVLWLYGKDHQITEVGAMNIFFLLKRRDVDGGGVELVTAPLTRGDILAGVTRDSILHIARSWLATTTTAAAAANQEICAAYKQPVDAVSERWLTMGEVLEASREGRLLEAFGAGTAAVVGPVKGIVYNGEEIVIPTGESGKAGPVTVSMWNSLRDLHYGRTDHPWSVPI